jgi:hypothetical protein
VCYKEGTVDNRSAGLKEKLEVRITLDTVLQKKGITKYAFAKNYLKSKPNVLSAVQKPGHDPKLSTLVKWAKLLECDVNELFEADGSQA